MSKWVFVRKESGGSDSWVPLDWKRRVGAALIGGFVFGLGLGIILGAGI